MSSNVYRFIERWRIPDFSPEEVYEVLSDARLLPEWWRGVYLAVEPFDSPWEPLLDHAARRGGLKGYLAERRGRPRATDQQN